MTGLKAFARRLPCAPALAHRLPFSLYVRLSNADTRGLVDQAVRCSPFPFTFVQVGSNDGRTGDPLFATVERTEVRGLLIEPIPELFERLTSTYADKRGLVFVMAAIAEDERSRTFYWVPPRPGDPIWVDQLGSFSRDVILSHAHEVPGIADRVETMSVQCRTLPSLLAEHEFTRVDLLHIDAEGADLVILKTLDFRASWSPRFVLYEQKHLGPEQASALALLHRAGYRTVDFGTDVFAFRGKGRHAVARRGHLGPGALRSQR
jgi:FkbM family methyltransferase